MFYLFNDTKFYFNWRCFFFFISVAASEMFPVNITDSDLQKNPEFAKLLNLLSQHLTSDGTSFQIQKDLEQVLSFTDKLLYNLSKCLSFKNNIFMTIGRLKDCKGILTLRIHIRA